MRLNKPKLKVKKFVMHIQGCNHRAYCGKPIDFEAAGRWFVEHESKDWRYCKTCFKLFAEGMGIEVNK